MTNIYLNRKKHFHPFNKPSYLLGFLFIILTSSTMMAQCEWTIEITTNSFGDEITWELTDENDDIILQNEGDSGDGIYTVEAVGPLTFHISTAGFFGDNDADYSISNGFEVVASGYVDEGEETTVEDLNCAELEPCDSAVAGNVESFSICAGTSFTLETEGVSWGEEGLNYQWESSSNGEDWTEIEEATTATYTLIDGIQEETLYRLTVSCEAGFSDTSETITVSLNSIQDCYCIPENSSGCIGGEYISNVTLEGESEILNNDSECSSDSYGDYTDLTPADLSPGESYTLSISTGYSFPTSQEVSAWIDFNKNGVFDDDELIQSTDGEGMPDGTVEFDLHISEEVEPGTYRMRIGTVYGNYNTPTSCGDEGYGEVEDYEVEIIELLDCEGPVSAGDIENTELSVCANTTFSVAVTNSSSPALGLTRIWQSSPAGDDNWSNLEGKNSNTLTLTEGIEEPTDFRYKVACNDNDPDYSDIISVNLNPGNECYCIPYNSGSSDFNYISNFQTTGGIININKNSEMAENGYADYTDTDTLKVYPGQEIQTITTFVGGTSYVKAWIDWDTDGNFNNEDELIINSEATVESAYTESLAIPEDVEVGTITRLRLRVRYIGGDMEPCEESAYGETEDYAIEVIESPSCLPITDLSYSEITPSSTLVTWEATQDETAWELKYGTAGFDIDSEGTILNIEDTPEAELTDLNSNTEYDVYLRALCDETDNSAWYGPVPLLTACNATDLPFIQDFSDANVPEIPSCDSAENAGEGNAWKTASYSLINGFSGQILQYDYSSEHEANAWYYTQGINLEAGTNYQISYKYGTNSSSTYEKLSVAYGSSPSHNEMSIELIDHNDIGNTSATTNTVVFSVPEDGVYYFGFNAHSDANQSFLYLDDIEVDFGPDCAAPIGLQVDDYTDVTAEISWEESINTTSWVISYGAAGYDPNTDGTEIEITDEDPHYELTGLEDNTSYDVYIRSNCSENEESDWAGPVSFKTLKTPPENNWLCEAFELFANEGCTDGPYTTRGADQEENEPTGSCTNNFSGTNTVWFSFIATSTDAVISTDFDSTEIQTEMVVFEAPEDCEDLSSLGEEVGCANATSEGILSLEDLTLGDTYYIKVGAFETEEGIFCIEVQMDENTPITCEEPSAITFGDVEDTSALTTWTPGGNENQWEVLYGETDFDIDTEGESVTVDAPEAILTGLTPETSYDVYVRALCEENMTSDWVGPENLVTGPMSVDSKIFNNFSFYPNPVEDQLNLNANASIEKVEVFNLLGQRVISLTPNTLDTQMDTQNLESGVYLMKVTIDGAEKTFRIVKK